MKFAHTLTEALDSANFPPDWQAAAIQYRALKKCIKRVTQELQELGLSVETLRALTQGSQDYGTGETTNAVLRYMFDGTVKSFQPKLMLTLRRTDGVEYDPGLSEETRLSLEKLVAGRRISSPSPPPSLTSSSSDETDSIHSTSTDSSSFSSDVPEVESIEIPLTSDSEFFHTLTSELSSLSSIESHATAALERDIAAIGTSVMDCTAPPHTSALARRSDMYPWREILRLYIEQGIFFSPLESERHAERSVEEAQAKLRKFTALITNLGLPAQFRHRDSRRVLARFLGMNEDVLRVLRFRTINKVAVRKILKKFDKRTALPGAITYPTFLTPYVSPSFFLASHLSRALCCTMSSQILTRIPQLDDYLCPICSSISIKPVRLSCTHVFCLRCLVKLQRERKNKCPMCRAAVVMAADAANLDTGMHNFLKLYFPKEAREKQKENEREVVMEQWAGVQANARVSGGCTVM